MQVPEIFRARFPGRAEHLLEVHLPIRCDRNDSAVDVRRVLIQMYVKADDEYCMDDDEMQELLSFEGYFKLRLEGDEFKSDLQLSLP